MKSESTRFGTIEVKDDSVLVFPSGILGFPEWTKYVLLDHDTDAPFKWLQCMEAPQLAFVVLDPAFFKMDYQIQIPLDALIEIQKTRQRRAVRRHDPDHSLPRPQRGDRKSARPAGHEPSHQTLQTVGAFRGSADPVPPLFRCDRSTPLKRSFASCLRMLSHF